MTEKWHSPRVRCGDEHEEHFREGGKNKEAKSKVAMNVDVFWKWFIIYCAQNIGRESEEGQEWKFNLGR